jgi:hypothetical protein
MKNFPLLILSIFLLSSCAVTLEEMQSEPNDWTIQPAFVLDWDGQTPVNSSLHHQRSSGSRR